MDKIVPRDIEEKKVDVEYDYLRAFQTFIIILILFLLCLMTKNKYYNMIENSRYMKFYPASTVFYQDYSSFKDFDKPIKLTSKYAMISYGIFKDEHGKDKFLIIAKSYRTENSPIVVRKHYSMLTFDGYDFISNSEEELKNVQQRIKAKNYEFIKTKEIKNLIKNLDANRDFTIVVKDASYYPIFANTNVSPILNKIFDTAVIQIFKRNDAYYYIGTITYKNKIAGIAANIKILRNKFVIRKSIKIDKFNEKNTFLIIGVKDFDLWSNIFIKIAKTIPDNGYNATLKIFQTVFNFDIEKDIIKKLNGNAVLYLFSDKKTMHPLLILDTKKDLATQMQKYLNYLQLPKNSKLTEKELNNKTFQVLNSDLYPHNLTFGSLNKNKFVLGHQNIIEKYLDAKDAKTISEDGDFYLYLDMTKIPLLNKNKLWKRYKFVELKMFLSREIYFEGTLK